MRRNTPIVLNGTLIETLEAGHDRTPIAVGSKAWFNWLETAQTFVFDDPAGRFTARKKRRSGNSYWYAFNRRSGRYREAYLGKSVDMELERLRSIASALEMPDRTPVVPQATALGTPRERPSPASRSGLHILPTKLAMPRVNPAQLVRTRISERLDWALQFPLTLISAPPGYGKTTLLAQWIAASQLSVAWVSLDSGDNDPAMFWTYVSAALDRTVRGLFETVWPQVHVIQPQFPNAVSDTIIAALSDAAGPMALVLDDYQNIRSDNRLIHEAVAYLVEHLPPEAHLVLVCRADPPLPLARLRARGHILELHAADLAFTLEESTDFLTNRMKLALPPAQVAALYERTEGWIGALQLAALSLRQRSNAANWLASFLDESRYMVDYLVEEVVQRVPSDMRSFLLRVALLDRLSAALCDAVTGSSNSQAMLAALERENMFLIPLADQPHWYRFHGLFASALRHYVRQHYPEIVPEVYVRASAWYEVNNSVGEAIEYAFAGQDVRRAAELLDASAENLLERGHISLLLDVLARLPDELVRERPRLCMAHAYVLYLSGRRETFFQRMHDAQQAFALADQQLNPTERDVLEGEILALSAAARTIQGQRAPGEIISSLEPSRASLPREHPLHGFANLFVGINQLIDGNVPAASGTLVTLMRASEQSGDMYLVGGSLLYLGVATVLQGRLEDTLAFCGRAARLVERYHDADLASVVHMITGMVLYERNDLGAALRELSQGAVVRYSRATALVECLSEIAYIHQAQGNPSGARQAIDESLAEWAQLQAGDAFYWVWWGSIIEAHQARLRILQGDVESARGWAHTLEHRGDPANIHEVLPPTYAREWEELVLARVYLAEGRMRDALGLLERVSDAAQAGGRMARLLEALVLQAVAYAAQDDTERALRVLQRAVELAAPERFIRTFLDGGPVIRRLLLLLLRDGEDWRPAPLGRDGREAWRSYVEALLRAIGPDEQSTSGDRWAIRSASQPRLAIEGQLNPPPLHQLLTKRQLEVLSLIAGGASNKALARTLGIKVNTVKRHVQNIYRQLSVQSRTQAIAKARDLQRLYLEPESPTQDQGESNGSHVGAVDSARRDAGTGNPGNGTPRDIEAQQTT